MAMTITKIPLELAIDDSDGSVTIRLRSPQQEDDDANTIRTHSPQQDDDRPLTRRIPEYLRTHPHSTCAAMEEPLHASKDVISSTCTELKKRGIVNNGVDGHTTWEWVAVT